MRPDMAWFGEVLMGEIVKKITWCELLMVGDFFYRKFLDYLILLIFFFDGTELNLRQVLASDLLMAKLLSSI